MEAEEFIKIYEYLKNEHEEEMAERYEEIMDVRLSKMEQPSFYLYGAKNKMTGYSKIK